MFRKNMSKNIGKNISKSLNSKYSQKLLDYAKQSKPDAFKTSSTRVIQKTVEATGDLIGKLRLSKTYPKNNSETNAEEIFREKYISSTLKQKAIDDLRLKEIDF